MSRGTWETGKEVDSVFAYRTITLYGRTFQNVRLTGRFVTSRLRRDGTMPTPATPDAQRSRTVTCTRFRLFPFRSPLLGESHCFLFLGVLRWFTSPRSLPVSYFIRKRDDQVSPGRVAPFGDPRVEACLRLTEAYRS